MEIRSHEVTRLNDPTGIIAGERYEILLDIDVPEEDELYSEKGLTLRVIAAADEVSGQELRIVQYFFIEKQTNAVLDFALEEEEEEQVLAYCRQAVRL